MRPFSLGAAWRLAYVCAMPIEVPNRAEWFPKIDAFPRPDWSAIDGWMRAWTDCKDADPIQQAIRHWLTRLRATLGGDYILLESEHFHLLSASDEIGRQGTLHFLEAAYGRLWHILGDAAWTNGWGKHVVLRFTDLDDYNAYISYFYPGDKQAASNGLFLRGRYAHIAYRELSNVETEKSILAYKLADNLVAHLPLPTWLSGALSQAFKIDITGRGSAATNQDLHAEHEKYWNPETIQEFWMGRSFQTEEGLLISYNLAQGLLDIVHREVRPPPEIFRRFIKQSTWEDAGETAALDQFEVSLGEIASVLLGEGDWTPKPATWNWKVKAL